MKVHKVEILIIDNEDIWTPEDIKAEIETCSRNLYCDVLNIRTAESPDIHDDHPLNKLDTRQAEIKRLFPD